MDYQRLPSCDAHATLDDLMLHYGQTSPRSMPPDVMVTMARHIDEDDVGRKRENRRLMVLILSALVVLIGISFAGASGLQESRHRLRKRDGCSVASAAPQAVDIAPPAPAPNQQGPPPAPECRAPTLVPAGATCAINSAAGWISCGGAAEAPSVCPPGTSWVNYSSMVGFAADCVDNRICNWNCKAYSQTVSTVNGGAVQFCVPPPAPTQPAETREAGAATISSSPPLPQQQQQQALTSSGSPAAVGSQPSASPTASPTTSAAAEKGKPPEGTCTATDACAVDSALKDVVDGACTGVTAYAGENGSTTAWTGSTCAYACKSETVALADAVWKCGGADQKGAKTEFVSCATSGWSPEPSANPTACKSS